MRITQGCFSFLPDLTDDGDPHPGRNTALDKGWAVNIEFTDDPHPRNTYWEMWGLPMFDLKDAAGVMLELDACRKVHGGRNISASPPSTPRMAGRRVRISFIVNRPKRSPASPDAQRRRRPGDSISVTGTAAGGHRRMRHVIARQRDEAIQPPLWIASLRSQ